MDLVEEVVGVAGRDLVLLRPRDAEALLSEEEFSRDEFLPYWAELWPSATALRWIRCPSPACASPGVAPAQCSMASTTLWSSLAPW